MSTPRFAAAVGFFLLLLLAACTQAPGTARPPQDPPAVRSSATGAAADASAADASAADMTDGSGETLDAAIGAIPGPSTPAPAIVEGGTAMRPAPRGGAWEGSETTGPEPGARAEPETAGAATPAPAPTSAPAEPPVVASAAEPARAGATDRTAGATDRTAGAAKPEPVRPAARVDRVRTVAIDPGHGGPEPGAAAGGFAESDVNLQIGRYLRDMLQEAGYRGVMTRDQPGGASPAYTQTGRPGQVKDLQARVDIATAAGADLFLSIHNNGSADPGVRGTEVWFSNARPFSDRNQALAQMVLDGILGRLRAAGHPAVDRGIQDDANWRFFNGRRVFIFVLSPSQTRATTQMPAALGESLFVSNPVDAAALRRSDIQWAIAAGYRDAVLAYFDRFPG